MPTVKFFTLGCKVNQYDSQEVREQFLGTAGFREVRQSEPAELYVVNTCTVTHKTDVESLSCVRRARRENPDAFVVVTGCLAERDAARIRGTTSADLVVPNKDKPRIVKLVADRSGFAVEKRGPPPATQAGITGFKGRTRAFLKIQDGCDNRCSYCKVRLVRGASRSKPADLVVAEARGLAKAGFKEIVLCGVCLGSYGRDLKTPDTLAGILPHLAAIRALARIRLSSIEAGDVSDALLSVMAQQKKLCRHLHIPMQSGDDGILKAMRRSYRRAGYAGLARRIRRFMPECALTTDILVGFPGEKEEHFANTLSLIRRINPSRVHVFPYSRREGTPASLRKDEVSPRTVRERLRLLRAAAQAKSRAYMQGFIGRRERVLFEEQAALGGRVYWQGYTDTYIRVRVVSRRDLANRIIPVTLTTLESDHLTGRL